MTQWNESVKQRHTGDVVEQVDTNEFAAKEDDDEVVCIVVSQFPLFHPKTEVREP